MKAIYILLFAVAITSILGCVAQEKAKSDSLNGYLPQGKNLPEGFRLVIALNNSTPGLNMTNEIAEFYGEKDIGPANAAIGKYWWTTPGTNYDAKVTVIALKDDEHAKAAVSNYLSNFKASGNLLKLPGNISLINQTTINGHDATEIGRLHSDDSIQGFTIQRLYLWSNKNMAVLVEGNSSRTISMQFATATGL
jgi:hypothetical protein